MGEPRACLAPALLLSPPAIAQMSLRLSKHSRRIARLIALPRALAGTIRVDDRLGIMSVPSRVLMVDGVWGGCSLSFSSLLSPPQFIPMPVLYGVFLYMGVASLNGVQVGLLWQTAILNHHGLSFTTLRPFPSPSPPPFCSQETPGEGSNC